MIGLRVWPPITISTCCPGLKSRRAGTARARVRVHLHLAVLQVYDRVHGDPAGRTPPARAPILLQRRRRHLDQQPTSEGPGSRCRERRRCPARSRCLPGSSHAGSWTGSSFAKSSRPAPAVQGLEGLLGTQAMRRPSPSSSPDSHRSADWAGPGGPPMRRSPRFLDGDPPRGGRRGQRG